MSANFSLSLANPAVEQGPANVVYTGLGGGNTLVLTIANHFGFDVTIGGSSAGKYLDVGISAGVLDAAGAAALTVASPWKVDGWTPPATGAGAQGPYTFHLLPPSGGVPLPDGGTIEVTLQSLEPSAAGTGQVTGRYAFDANPADDLSVSASLSSLAPPNPDLPDLVGDADALRFTLFVNGGGAGNPVMVSAAPATPDDAVQNTLHLNFLFQRAPTFGMRGSADDSPDLVPGWDPAHPPTFRVFFPYFNRSETLPAPLDLTDSLRKDDPSYNALTSAWNIAGSLDPDDPDVTRDDFWQIELDPNAPVPVWTATPTTANQHLFTVTAGDPSQPGPVLDLYLSRIVSALPIDPLSPETLLYLQWNDFPGFNDGVAVYPLRKTALAVTSFSARVDRRPSGPRLVLDWDTRGAAYCLVTGDTARQAPTSAPGTEYVRALTADAPLRSAYTLTAVAEDGVTTVSRTVSIRWQPGTQAAVPNSTVSVEATPDGRELLLVTPAGGSIGVGIYDAQTLEPRPVAPIVPPGGASALVSSPDGATVYVATFDGKIYGYDLATQQQTPGSGADASGGSGMPYLIGTSLDGARVTLITGQALVDNQPVGANQVTVLNGYDLHPASGSPVPLPGGSFTFARGAVTGRYYVANEAGVLALDAASYRQVSGSPAAVPVPGLVAVSPDESVAFAVGIDAERKSFVLCRVDVATMRVDAQLPVGIGYFGLTEAFMGVALAALAFSADGSTLFFIGLDVVQLVQNGTFASKFLAFDAATLQELSWSPLRFGDFLPIDIAMSPDGSRLYVLTGEHLGQQDVTTALSAVDPVFA